MHATLSAPCVRKGAKETITIVTAPLAGVAYDAVYSDGKDGRPQYGYGGNFGGKADSSGHWQNTWTVSLKAPSGKGTVQVVAGTRDAIGRTSVPFAVADLTGHCA